MQFNITGKHLEITPAIREHVETALKELEGTFFKITSSQVTLKTEKHNKIAEATLAVAGHGTIHGDAQHADMYVAVDQLKEKLATQLQKIKSKEESH